MTNFVLVHGSYQGGWIWREITSRLRAQGHTVFAPTLDGCAERRHQLRPGIDTTTHAMEIAELLFYEDLRDVVLVGTSSGGMVVCRAAEQMRERIARLVLVDALALFNGERTRDIVNRSAPAPYGLAAGPSREDAATGLFGDLEPGLREWVLDRYTPDDAGEADRFLAQNLGRDGGLVQARAQPRGGASAARGGAAEGEMVGAGHRPLSDAEHAGGTDGDDCRGVSPGSVFGPGSGSVTRRRHAQP
jgi:pimeloyl-ACP methyl ester carboxylesterase